MFRGKRYVDCVNPLVKRGRLDDPSTHAFPWFPFVYKAMTVRYEAMRMMLQLELARNPTYQDVWNEAHAIFQQKIDFFKQQAKQSIPDECFIAIIAYTFEKVLPDGKSLQIYVDFNKLCREMTTESSWMRFPYKSLYCLLLRIIDTVHSVPDNNQPPYYRGLSFHYSEDFPDEEIIVDFSQFTSFTASREQALNFIEMNGGKGTLLVMTTPPMAGVGIKNFSLCEHEEEMLVPPWSLFMPHRFKRDGDIHEIQLTSRGPILHYFPYTYNLREFKGLQKMTYQR